MNKNKLNNPLREFVRKNLSPTQAERDLVASLYSAFKDVLGNNCQPVGSFARFTASRPLHDLDILFIAGAFDPNHLDPKTILNSLQNTLKQFRNPTSFQTSISLQTHSVTVSFLENGQEKFAVDIVPAFTSGSKNEYGDDIYWVPEIITTGQRTRKARYEEFAKNKKSELDWWIKSDPRGYIKATSDLNAQNADFRKTAKFIKRWKHNCKTKNDGFKLKSFHIEQVIFQLFKSNPGIEIYEVVFKFFCAIPNTIARPQIKDRADQGKFIDEYLTSLTEEERKRIIEARDFFLIKLEKLSDSLTVAELLVAGFYTRISNSEEFLFDSKIPVLLESGNDLRIAGRVLQREGGFRERLLDALGLIDVDRRIEFRIDGARPVADLFKWKVKNDDNSPQPRGEITDHTTRHDPEHTKYKGSHYVECYAIKDGVCIARSKQNVVLRGPFA
jgi:hypothetical protein